MLVLGDLHLQENWIKKKQVENFFNWLNEQEFIKNEKKIILLGDLFEIPTPDSQLVLFFLNLFANKWNDKYIYILQGNHDYNLETSSLNFFDFLENVKIIKDKEEEQIEGKSVLFLPYYSHENTNKKPMIEYYSSIEGKWDYIFGHIEDDTQHFGTKYCDLSKIKGKKVFGHIHTPDIQKKGNYLGSCIRNSSTEKNDKKYLALISKDNFELIEIPVFMEYETIEYGEEIKTKNNLVMLNVTDAPSRIDAVNFYESKYSNAKINKVITKRQKTLENEKVTKSSDKDNWILFCKEKGLPEQVKNICEQLMG